MLKHDYFYPLLFCIHHNSRTPDMLLHFQPASGETLSAGKPIRSKNNFSGITVGRDQYSGFSEVYHLLVCDVHTIIIIKVNYSYYKIIPESFEAIFVKSFITLTMLHVEECQTT